MTHGPDSPPAGAEPDPLRAEGGTGAEADVTDPKPAATEERSPAAAPISMLISTSL